MKYKIIDDITSDVIFEAHGKTIKELFENSAEALMSIICQPGKIKPKNMKEVAVEGESEEDLLFNWLQEIIARVDIDGMFFSKFEITSINNKSLKAKCYGEPVTAEKGGTVVKSLTYHRFKLEKTKNGYKAVVCLDV